jgi:hypothetical protein
VKKLRKSKEAAFNQQSNLVHHFLSKRNYKESYIEEYSRSGLLSRITALSCTYFFALEDLHHASCRTLEQQGREDDEGEGWRLAVDVKSDLC